MYGEANSKFDGGVECKEVVESIKLGDVIPMRSGLPFDPNEDEDSSQFVVSSSSKGCFPSFQLLSLDRYVVTFSRVHASWTRDLIDHVSFGEFFRLSNSHFLFLSCVHLQPSGAVTL